MMDWDEFFDCYSGYGVSSISRSTSSSTNESFHSTSMSLDSLNDSTFSTNLKNFDLVHINAQSIPSHFAVNLTT